MKLIHSVLLVVVFLLFLSPNLISQFALPPSSGDGTSGNPYQISSLDNLYWITQTTAAWSQHYIQTANIDASSTSGWDSGNGFSPIGSGSNSFTGSYDGGGYTISGLYISRGSTDYIGMFGFISDGTVKNVSLTDVDITGSSYVAGVVGFSTGSGSAQITNCSSTGTIFGSTSNIGGVIGKTQAGTTVTKCFSNATVSSSSGNNLGGFVGFHDQFSSITLSYSNGNVSSSSGDHVGGFVGTMASSATITNCYSTGDATSGNRAGGFAGSKSSGTITNCYSIGTASGGTIGGFIGLNSGTVSNSFWDTEASGNGSSAAGTGKTTAEMKTQSTFTDASWDFDEVWEIIGGNYPRLQDNSDPGLPVELISFTALLQNGTVTVRWKTATEVNNYGFEIEKSRIQITDDRSQNSESSGHESNAWTKVGFVEGSGTTNAPKEYSFTEKNLSVGTYAYRLKQIDRNGKFLYSQEVEVTIGNVPKIFALEQNYPNPFNPSTVINYHLSATSNVTLKVYDAIGKEVATLVNEVKDAGYYSATFNASKLSTGMYFARLNSEGKSQMIKLLLMK